MIHEGHVLGGFLAGFALGALFTAFSWHSAESQCQRINNVADCFWKADVAAYVVTPSKVTPDD